MSGSLIQFDISLNEKFPEEARQDLLSVAKSVLNVIQRKFPGLPPDGNKPIVCTAVKEIPRTLTFSDRYLIELSSIERYYAQFAYQLGHELGHVWLGPRRSNGLVETLATAISHQVLDDMAINWEVSPPYAHWRDYAPNFVKYRKNTENAYVATFPTEVQSVVQNQEWQKLSLYLRYRRNDQDRNMLDRALNCLGTIMLRSGEIPWSELVGLAWLTHPSPNEDGNYRHDLQIDLSQAPETIQSVLQRLGRGCSTNFFAAKFANRPDAAMIEETGLLFEETDAWVWLVEDESGNRDFWKEVIQKLNPRSIIEELSENKRSRN